MDLSAFVSVASLLLWAAAFLYFRSYIKRRTGESRLLEEFRAEVEKLIAEIDTATDRDVTLVEDRVRSLRAMLEEADRRLASYTRELDRRGAEERAYAELGRRAARPFRGVDGELSVVAPAQSVAPSPVAAPVSAASAASNRARTQAESPSSEARAGPSSAERDVETAIESPGDVASIAGPRFVRTATPIEPKAAPFAERVAELHRAGFSADLIAKRLGATVAEVDLAVALTGRTE